LYSFILVQPDDGIISVVKPTGCPSVSNLFYFGITCFGRYFRSSSGVQDCTYSNRHLSNRYEMEL